MYRDCIKRLNDAAIRYAVLHGWNEIEKSTPSDLDIIVDKKDFYKVEAILKGFGDFKLVQKFHYEAHSYGFVLASWSRQPLLHLVVDVSFDYRWNGVVFFSDEELLQHRMQEVGVWVLSPQAEFSYLLVKRIFEKGQFERRHRDGMQQLACMLKKDAMKIATTLLGSSWGPKASDWISGGYWDRLNANVQPLRSAMRLQLYKRDPLNAIRYWIPELKRLVVRFIRPTGIFIVVMGPDGSGKSTLVEKLKEQRLGAFRKAASYHFRPALFRLRTSANNASSPHGKPTYPSILSHLKVIYYAVDTVLGYFIKIRPLLVRSTLVLFDRYFDDLLIDPTRYRFGGSQRLIRMITGLVPRPDIFVFLNVSEKQLLSRKNEVSAKELGKQLEEYRAYAATLPNAAVIDGGFSVDEACRRTCEVIYEYLYLRRNK